MAEIPPHTLNEMTAGVLALANARGEIMTWEQARQRAITTVTQAERWKIMSKWMDEGKVKYDATEHAWIVNNGGPTTITLPVEGPRPQDEAAIPQMASETLITQIMLLVR